MIIQSFSQLYNEYIKITIEELMGCELHHAIGFQIHLLSSHSKNM